ncbi:protein TESPA1-like [Tachyglossus aculeatus]|uniref:protein TESPA1-like n=1 Tax=Tachyglossus aculeatus TaxID=9261 RepID=UPI0018F5F3B1|nr:protein TESPA1-like [Tachyglossus aculeatus]
MDDPSTLIQASWERRRAWLRQGRRRRPRGLEAEEEEDARAGETAEIPGEPEEEPPLQDDVFEEGNPSLQMVDWLRNCRSSEEGAEEESSLSITDGFYRTATSLDDDLTVGAEGMLLAANGKLFPRSFLNPFASFPGAAPSRGRLARMVQETMGWAREEEFCEGVKARNDPTEERETAGRCNMGTAGFEGLWRGSEVS